MNTARLPSFLRNPSFGFSTLAWWTLDPAQFLSELSLLFDFRSPARRTRLKFPPGTEQLPNRERSLGVPVGFVRVIARLDVEPGGVIRRFSVLLRDTNRVEAEYVYDSVLFQDEVRELPDSASIPRGGVQYYVLFDLENDRGVRNVRDSYFVEESQRALMAVSARLEALLVGGAVEAVRESIRFTEEEVEAVVRQLERLFL